MAIQEKPADIDKKAETPLQKHAKDTETAQEVTGIPEKATDLDVQENKSAGAPNTSLTAKKETDNTAIKEKIGIKGQKKISGLSLKSLQAKKAHELNKIEVVIDEDQLPKSDFTEEELRKHWAEFVALIDKKGQKILASNLNTDVPRLKEDFTITIELPNGTMKKEIEREQFELMSYLRTKLDNHFIQLSITVNEESAKKFAFTPEEKYEKLREKNPAIDLLRKTFDLDL